MAHMIGLSSSLGYGLCEQLHMGISIKSTVSEPQHQNFCPCSVAFELNSKGLRGCLNYLFYEMGLTESVSEALRTVSHT